MWNLFWLRNVLDLWFSSKSSKKSPVFGVRSVILLVPLSLVLRYHWRGPKRDILVALAGWMREHYDPSIGEWPCLSQSPSSPLLTPHSRYFYLSRMRDASFSHLLSYLLVLLISCFCRKKTERISWYRLPSYCDKGEGREKEGKDE